MSCRYFLRPESLCTSSMAVSISSTSPAGEERTVVSTRNRSFRTPPSSLLVRLAMRVSRSRWFSFLRRVFHYQNGSRSELGSNPFNSGAWMIMECTVLVLQIVIILYSLSVSKVERPVWLMRIWLTGYAFGCVVSLMLLHWRYRLFYASSLGDEISLPDIEQQRSHEEPRSLHCFNKCRTSTELFFAIWFVVGNVWVFDSRLGSFHHDPKIHTLCTILLVWNAISYSFPFILFVLLCCCVPALSSLLGYNMNMGSTNRGALEEQLSSLPTWRYKEIGNNVQPGNSALDKENPECCICLAKYIDKEEIRQLPCSHVFHLKCVDQWLRIISCCPLCKQPLEK